MLQGNKPVGRSSCVVGIGLVLAGFLAMAGAASAQDRESPAALAGGVESTASMTVVRDAETGQLRAPTAAELQTLNQGAARARSLSRMAPATPLQKFHSGGARGARLTDEFLSAALAVRQADGGLDRQCFDSHDHASDAARAPAQANSTVRSVKE
ncbi:MAG: hypothetical protein RR784_02340 [Burkholderiaceae bacterium]